MKKLVFIAILLTMMAGIAPAQNLQRLFDKYADDERFSYVSVGAGAFNLASVFAQMDNMEEKGKKMLGKMKGIKILSLESGNDDKLMQSLVNDFDRVIKSGNFEKVVEVRDKGERVNIFFQVTGKDNMDMVIFTREKNEVNLIWISGKMTREEMKELYSQHVGSPDLISLME